MNLMRNDKFYSRLWKVSLGMILFGLLGCNVSGSGESESTISPVASLTSATTSTATQSVPIPTMTIIPSSTMELTSTVTFTPPPIIDLTPTLTLDEREAYLLDLLSACRLPCWGNLIPDQSTIETGYEIFGAVNIEGVVEWAMDNQFAFNFSSIEFEVADVVVTLTEKDQQIKKMKLWMIPQVRREEAYDALERYSIQPIFKEYGPPSEIRIIVYPPVEAGPAGYRILLFYEQQGFTVEYSALTDPGLSITICPEYAGTNSILVTMYSIDGIDEEIDLSDWKKLDDTTDINVGDFYSEITTSGMSCFTTQSDYWR